MKKSLMHSALRQSLALEAQQVDKRFDAAENLFKNKAPRINTGRELVVRDTFSMPASDCALIGIIKSKCLRLGLDTTRSEIVRAGILHLAHVSEKDLLIILGKITKLKPGRTKLND